MLMKNLFRKFNSSIGRRIIAIFMALMILITSTLLNIVAVVGAEDNYPDKMIKITAPTWNNDANAYSIMTKVSLTAGHTYRLEMYQSGILGVKYNLYANGTTWTQYELTGTTANGLTTYEFTPSQNYVEIRINIGGAGRVSYVSGLKLVDTEAPDTNLINDPTTSGNFDKWCRGMLNQNQIGSNGTGEVIYNTTHTSMDALAVLQDFDKNIFGIVESEPTSKFPDKMIKITAPTWNNDVNAYSIMTKATVTAGHTYRLEMYQSGILGVKYNLYANGTTWTQYELTGTTANGLTTYEFTPSQNYVEIRINIGGAGRVSYVSGLKLVDTEAPDTNLINDPTTSGNFDKWCRGMLNQGQIGFNGTGEVIYNATHTSMDTLAVLEDFDKNIFGIVESEPDEPEEPDPDYNDKMLHLKTSSWGEYGTGFLGAANLKGKTFRLTYYFKGEGGNGDYSMRVWYWYDSWASNNSVTFTKNEVDSATGMHTMEFTIPDNADAIKIYINEGYAADADIWVSDVSLIDIANPDKELQGDWLEKWSGSGTAEIVDKDLTIFLPKETSNKMLHLKTSSWGEYGTGFLGAANLKGKTFRLTYYFKGEGGNGDYSMRVWYWYDSWASNKSVTFTKNEVDSKTGMHTMEFTVPDNADAIKIYINEGYAADADIWVSDVSLIDIANPDKELQGDWLEKWSGQGTAELIDKDLEIFKPMDYSTKTLKITSTAQWAEYKGNYELTIGKSYEFSYYFRYESKASDDIPSMRVMSGSTILKTMLIEDDDYNKFTIRFTVPENSPPLANDSTKAKITFCLNEAMNIGNQMWLHIISLVDVQDSEKTDLAEDKFQRWNGSGDMELFEFNKEEFLKSGSSSKAQYMLIVPNKASGVEYGTTATVKPNNDYRLNMYYSDEAEKAVKVYYKNQNDEFKSIKVSISKVENLFFIYNFDFKVPADAKKDKNGNTEIYVRLVSNKDKTVYCYMPRLTSKNDTEGESLIRDPGLKHNFNKWNSFKIGTEEIVMEMYNFNYSGFDSGKFVSPSAKTMIKAEAIYRMATFGVSPQLEIGKTYEFSMYCCGVKTSEFHIYYYDNNYNWKALLTDSETYSETELFKTYVFTVPDDALKSDGTNKTAVHLRFSAGAQGSVNYLYKTTLVDVKNKNTNLINDPSLSHSFDGWYVINYESPGFSAGGAVNGLSLVALDMNTFVDDSSDRPYNDGEWVKKFGIKSYLLGIDESDSMFDDTYLDEEPLNNGELKQDEQTDDGESKENVVTTVIKKRKKVYLPEEDYTWIYISCVAAAVLIAGGVTAFVIIKKKKNKVL